jgi:hypothetical protein
MANRPRAGAPFQVRLSDAAAQNYAKTLRKLRYDVKSSRGGIAGYLNQLFSPPLLPPEPPYPFEDNRPEDLRLFDYYRLTRSTHAGGPRLPLWLPDRYTAQPHHKRKPRMIGSIRDVSDAMYAVALHYGISSPSRDNVLHRNSIIGALIEAIGLDYLHPTQVPMPIQFQRRTFARPFELVY